MSDRALSEEAMLASLRGLRLPAEAAGGWAADVAVAVGVAALCAMVAVGIARLWSVKRAPERVADRLAALDGLPEDQQRVALLHLLKARAPERFEAVRDALYRPEGAVDLAQLRSEVTRYG